MESSYVANVFNSVAGRYDLANHVLSFGMDYLWRKKTVSKLKLVSGMKVLDMCCGTGDLAFEIAKRKIDGVEITGCDFSARMLEIARQKEVGLIKKGKILPGCIKWVDVDCSNTDLPDSSFDRITCAFGLRNMQHILDDVLKEMDRLLKCDGSVSVLEFSLPQFSLVRWIYLVYLKRILPLTGGSISGDTASYRYLADSICQWSSQVDLSGSFERAGLTAAGREFMSFGTVCLDIAKKKA